MAKAAKTKETPVTENQFKFEGKVYRVTIPIQNIPGIGIRTALEVCADPEAQAYLVGCNTLGHGLEEVIVD